MTCPWHDARSHAPSGRRPSRSTRGQKPDPATNARAVPIYATTSYVFNDAAHAARLFGLQEFGNIYTRIMNPTTDVFEERVAALEGGVGALGLASGQAAETLVDPQPRPRRRQHRLVVAACTAARTTCSPTRCRRSASRRPSSTAPTRRRSAGDRRQHEGRLPRDDRQPAPRRPRHRARSPTWPTRTACRSSSTTRSRRCSPSRSSTAPTSSSTRRRSGSAATARRSAASSSTAARSTGRLRRASRQDFVDPDPSYHGVSYTTAFGHLAFILKLRVQGLRDIGPALSPFNAFLFLQGLETLPLRIERHSENALAVAQWLETQPEVTWVSYPGLPSHPRHELAKKYLTGGFGGIVTFGVKGGVEAGRRLIDNVKIFSLLANVGDAKSLIIHPASTTHSQLEPEEQVATGTTPDLIRLSVGLEHVDDLIADLTQALAAATAEAPRDGELSSARHG